MFLFIQNCNGRIYKVDKYHLFMKPWLIGALIGFIAFILYWIIFYFLGIANASLMGILFPLVFLVVLGAFIGSWVGFIIRKVNSNNPVNLPAFLLIAELPENFRG